MARQPIKVDRRHQLDADDWASLGRWVNVKSSNVGAIKYDWDLRRLYVQFKNGSVYSYEGVHPVTARNMFNSASMGKFVWQRLRDKFAYRRLF